MNDKEKLKNYSLIKRETWSKDQINALAEKLEQEKHTSPFQEKNTKELKLTYSLSSNDISTATNELIKRYTYLYENKELILALCIRPAIEEKQIKLRNKSFKKEARKRTLTQEEKELIKIFISDNKNILNGNKIKYYLFSKVEDEITDAYKEFLFTEKEMENTTLYKHIEAVKNNEMYLMGIKNMIEQLEERRKYHNQMSNTQTFTVWKILTYVREKNIDNPKLLKTLDKYYNLDRYITTGFNFESGYEFLEKDIDDKDYNDKDYLLRIQNHHVIYSLIEAHKKFNKFEDEDEYYDSYIEYQNTNDDYDYTTRLMYMIGEMPPIKEEDKQELRNKLIKDQKVKTKTLK